jgi:hypothetical protein
MKAKVGDRLILEGTHVGDPRRVGIVTRLRRDDGEPPYVVRWLDTGASRWCFPARTPASRRPGPEAGRWRDGHGRGHRRARPAARPPAA